MSARQYMPIIIERGADAALAQSNISLNRLRSENRLSRKRGSDLPVLQSAAAPVAVQVGGII